MHTALPAAQVDHLVMISATLDEGVQWCEATLGRTPGPGGQHALMGTHNRLFRIASKRYPLSYFELIAIDPQASAPGRARWFDMDDPALRELVAGSGPQLAHFVVRVPDARAALAALGDLGLNGGEVLQASRQAPQGLLQWQITVRADGRRLLHGTLPTLIQWGHTHPAQTMADSGISLQSLTVTHPQPDVLQAAYKAIGLEGVHVLRGPARLSARLHTARGPVELRS